MITPPGIAHPRTFALHAVIARLQLEIKGLTASLKKRTSLLQRVSAQVQLGKSTTQVVANTN
jgi:protein-arginine kinase